MEMARLSRGFVDISDAAATRYIVTDIVRQRQ
jgi:hypothetical protein